jgi:hypothetical protein
VEQIIKQAQARVKYQFPINEHPEKINEFIVKECKNERVSIKELRAGGRRRKLRTVRAQIAIGLVETYGVSLAEVARQLYVTTSAVSRIISRANQQVNLINNVTNLPKCL